jgi:asparagine synthase (glutamine-hydrolysing)
VSGLCGWSGHAGAEGLLSEMARPLAEHDGSRTATWVDRDRGLAVARRDDADSLIAQGGMAAAVVGRPYWEDPELAEVSRGAGSAAALLEGYRRRGVDIVKETRGAFALAVVDPDRDRVLLATDRVGIRPLLYHRTGACLVFGSASTALDVHPRAEAEIDPQGIFNYVFFSYVPAPGAIRRGRCRLLPGEYVLLEKGKLHKELYAWSEYRDHDRTPVRELEEEIRRLVRESVRREAEGARVGAFLSGGVDSSAVSGFLSELSDGPARTYSIGFDAEGYDEMRYARVAAKRFATDHHEYYVTPADVVAAVPRIARIYAEPFGNESAVPTYYCARLAREDGVDRLLAGDGGDELFGGNKRYARQKIFELYKVVPRPLRRWLLEPVLFRFPLGDLVWPVRKGRAYVRKANTPLPERIHAYNEVYVRGAAAVFEPEFLAQVDPGQPMGLLREVYHGAHARTSLNRTLALDAKFTLSDVDLPKVSRMCELAGVSVTYPLLDTPILDFAARLDVGLKVKRFKLRYFFKRAMRGFLPEETLAKQKHGFGLPFGTWLRTDRALQALSEESLANLKARRIIRPAYIDDLLRGHRDVHAVSFGESIWHLMMLEQWYQAHVDDRSVVPTRS